MSPLAKRRPCAASTGEGIESLSLARTPTPWVEAKSPAASPLAILDFAEEYTAAVRRALRTEGSARHAVAFDFRGPPSLILADPVALQCALHRLLCGAMAVLDQGLLILDAEIRPSCSGRLSVRAQCGATGALASDAAIDGMLQRLSLTEHRPRDDASHPRLRQAQGLCPRTGGQIVFSSRPGVGMLLKYEQTFPLVEERPAEPQAQACQARAWVVGPDGVATESLARRLQRNGWATTRFVSPADAMRRLANMPPTQARPALVIATELPPCAHPDLPVLARKLPARSRCLLLVAAGAQELAQPNALEGVERQVGPLSPSELDRLTADAAEDAEAGSGLTLPMPLLQTHRPRMLVVDDDEINRLVGKALAESLGYEPQTACNGVEAIAMCQSTPPAAVLMDIEMPQLNGIDATARLRELQRTGDLLPFPIVMATAAPSPENRQKSHHAGADGFVAKPLLRDTLMSELRRVTAGCAVTADHPSL